jgi:hypothetical protein
MAAATTVRLACAAITPHITRRSSGIPTATGSKPSAISRSERSRANRTAQSYSARRGGLSRHQKLEGGAIFRDPFAASMLDEETRARLDDIAADPAQRPMRLFVAAPVRWQLVSMYRKTGTKRQAELVRLLLSLAMIWARGSAKARFSRPAHHFSCKLRE